MLHTLLCMYQILYSKSYEGRYESRAAKTEPWFKGKWKVRIRRIFTVKNKGNDVLFPFSSSIYFAKFVTVGFPCLFEIYINSFKGN